MDWLLGLALGALTFLVLVLLRVREGAACPLPPARLSTAQRLAVLEGRQADVTAAIERITEHRTRSVAE